VFIHSPHLFQIYVISCFMFSLLSPKYFTFCSKLFNFSENIWVCEKILEHFTVSCQSPCVVPTGGCHQILSRINFLGPSFNGQNCRISCGKPNKKPSPSQVISISMGATMFQPSQSCYLFMPGPIISIVYIPHIP
jgi:hypothetical protein